MGVASNKVTSVARAHLVYSVLEVDTYFKLSAKVSVVPKYTYSNLPVRAYFSRVYYCWCIIIKQFAIRNY